MTFFSVIADPGWYIDNIPSRRHKTAYPLSFVDGHVEAFKFLCRDTLTWVPPEDHPREKRADGSLNQDVVNLRKAAYKGAD